MSGFFPEYSRTPNAGKKTGLFGNPKRTSNSRPKKVEVPMETESDWNSDMVETEPYLKKEPWAKNKQAQQLQQPQQPQQQQQQPPSNHVRKPSNNGKIVGVGEFMVNSHKGRKAFVGQVVVEENGKRRLIHPKFGKIVAGKPSSVNQGEFWDNELNKAVFENRHAICNTMRQNLGLNNM